MLMIILDILTEPKEEVFLTATIFLTLAGIPSTRPRNKLVPQLINQTMNRAQAVAPALLSRASQELDKVAAKRIDQIAQRTGETLQKVAPDIIKGGFEELYKHHFVCLEILDVKSIKNLSQMYLRG